MLQDVRIRDSNRSTKIPATYQAFIYGWYGVDSIDYKVIIAPDRMHADQLLRDWAFREGLDNAFFRFIDVVDWMLCGNETDMNDILL